MSTARATRLDRLRRRQRTQVLVVGGGINGIGTFRELALNGVDVVLVERGDFMSAASSAPSRMIHGGLRYMENGEFELVRESLRERNLLLANAPHLVTPLPTLIPITSRLSGIWSAALRFCGANVAPGDRGALIVKLGLTLYDLYAGKASGMPRHRFFDRRETLRRWPSLRPDVIGSAVYYDAKISHPERLGLELVLESERDGNAIAFNHVGLTGIGEGKAVLEDRIGGDIIEIEADVVVNATGAWIDLTNAALTSAQTTLIGGTKGSHIVIDDPHLLNAVGEEMIYFANGEGRVCILFAHQGKVLAGSTDITVDTPEGVRCEQAEVDYILASVREVFPDLDVTEDRIIYRFAGVRPLPNGDGKVTANISRDHSCEWLPDGAASRPVLNLIGGKWTTFRAFGEMAADKVLERLGMARRADTRGSAVGGGRDFPEPANRSRWLEQHANGVPADYAERLLARYGTRAAALARQLGGQPHWLRALPTFTREEIVWLIANELVATLADLVLRRMTVAFSGELSRAAIEELGGICAAELGWDDATESAEVSRLLASLEYFHGLSADRLASRNPDLKGTTCTTPEKCA